MLFRIAVCAFSIAEGVQVRKTDRECTAWCKDSGCPRGTGCCVNPDDMAVLSKSKQNLMPKRTSCLKKGNSWCQTNGNHLKLVNGAEKKVCKKPDAGNNGLGRKPRCYCSEMGCQPGNTCCINDASKKILQSYNGKKSKETQRKCMASGKNSWCGVAGGRNKKGNRVEEDCVIEISKTTTLAGPADPFNCLTREVWSGEKVEWCCANKNLGCTTTPVAPTTAAPEPFNCLTRELWSEEKVNWCCANKNLGCTTTPAAPVDPEPPVAEPAPEPQAQKAEEPVPPQPQPAVEPEPPQPQPAVEPEPPVPPVDPAPPTTTPAAEVSAVDDPHLTDLAGDKFDLYSAGSHELVVIPQGASPKDANLVVSGEVEQFGERKNDLWIRTLNIRGKWVQGGSYSFKTNNAPFGNKATVLVRKGKHTPWVTVDDLDDSNLVITSDLDAKAPYADFSESVSRKAEVMAGPVRVQVSWATAQKDGDDVNHLDVHVKGLGGVKDAVGGLLAGEISS